MNKDYNYEYEHDDRYCYKGSNVLKNKLNIKDSYELNVAEREITSLRMMDAKINSIKGNFDFKHLCAIHKYLFGDLFKWAGEIRWVNIAKGNMFCNYEFIQANADELFKKLKNENFLKDTSKNEVSIRLAYYLSEINVLHPFREGNGRTQRLFIEYLAESIGYRIDFSEVTEKEMVDASATSFLCDYTKMNEIFITNTYKIENNEESK